MNLYTKNKEQRDKAINEAKALAQRAKEEGRQLNDYERFQFDELMRTADSHSTVIDDLTARAASITIDRNFSGPDSVSNEMEIVGRSVGGYLRGDRRAMSEGTPSAGGYTTPTIVDGAFVTALTANIVAARAGAQVITLDSDLHNFATVSALPTFHWRAENAEISASDPTLGQVAFDAEAGAVLVQVSNELLQDSVNIDKVLGYCLTQATANAIDAAAFVGTGSNNIPLGIKGYSNLGYSVAMATDGSAISSYDTLITGMNGLYSYNVNDITAFVMHPRTFTDLAKLKESTTDAYLQKPDILKNIPFFHTTAIPITDTQGQSNAASAIYFGNFKELVIGYRQGLKILTLDQRYAEFGMTAFLAWVRVDIQPLHTRSFGRIYGINAA